MDTITKNITPMSTMPTKNPEAQLYITLLHSMPDSIRELMMDPQTSLFIIRMRDEYKLEEEKRFILAQFLRDAILGIPIGKNIATGLAERLEVNNKTALQIIHKIENELLGPINRM